MHPSTVVYLEHDGKVFLVDETGDGPQHPTKGNMERNKPLRFPTAEELQRLNISYTEKGRLCVRHHDGSFDVVKAYPSIAWPDEWAWKDACVSDNNVHPVARDAIYRSIHRLVSKVMICNTEGNVLMAKVERGHFHGFWTLPGGYMDHDEHPATGCVRETLEELGLDIVVNDAEPVITQRIFNDEGISFVSFTYKSSWDGSLDQLTLLEEEISEAAWFEPKIAHEQAVSHFDREALRTLL